jgi:hypothetical protein
MKPKPRPRPTLYALLAEKTPTKPWQLGIGLDGRRSVRTRRRKRGRAAWRREGRGWDGCCALVESAIGGCVQCERMRCAALT